jgi:hypothetical protein
LTVQILLSQSVPADQFAAALEAHRADLAAHRLGKVGVPVPAAHPLLDGLIQCVPQTGPVHERGPDDFVIVPYEIVDDTPPPPTLAERRNALVHQVNLAAQVARDAILSPAKAALVGMDANDAALRPDGARTPAEQAAIDLYNEFQSRCVDINKAALRATVEIEDLTESTIDGWKIPSF